MRLIRTLSDVDSANLGASVAIGNFDGVHPGHQAVIGRALAEARRRGAPSGVVTFEPHPRRFFAPQSQPFTLTTLDDKARLLAALHIGLLCALDFNPALAALSAEAFVEEVLVKGLKVAHVVIGHDFHFGRNRQGTPEGLEDLGHRHGFSVERISPVEGEAGVYSSTAIRDALRQGRPDVAAHLLGRPWTVSGIVAHGDKRGRLINFPTANVVLGEYLEPALGVYAVQARSADGAVLSGVANIGRRPTFGGEQVRLEAHLFDFKGDLYDQRLEIALIEYIRAERKFDGLDALKAQIAQDADAARRILADVQA